MSWTKGQQGFINEQTVKLMVGWCDREIRGLSPVVDEPPDSPYVKHAKEKGWVSKTEDRILAQGWGRARNFLRR